MPPNGRTDGTTRQGQLDDEGFVRFDGIPPGQVEITVGPDARPFEKYKLPLVLDDDLKQWMES